MEANPTFFVVVVVPNLAQGMGLAKQNVVWTTTAADALKGRTKDLNFVYVTLVHLYYIMQIILHRKYSSLK